MANNPIKKDYLFENKARLIGRVTKKDEFVNFVPFPVFGLEIEVPIDRSRTERYQFETLEGEEASDFFYFRVIFFNNENVISEIEVGDIISVDGELQSRNFYQQHPMMDDLLQSNVDIYQNLFNKLPVEKEPTQHMRQAIKWKALMDMNLIDQVPADSKLNEFNVSIPEPNKPYTYKVDWNGQVTKETEESILEVVCFNHQILENLPKENNSSVLISGRISDKPFFDIDGSNIYTQFKVQTFQKSFEPKEKRFVFVNIKVLGVDSQTIFQDYKKNDHITFAGTLVSEEKSVSFKVKKISASNKVKKKKITIQKTDRFILSLPEHLKKQ